MADKAMLLDGGRRRPGLRGKQRGGAGQWRARLAELFPEATGQTATDTIRPRSRRLAVSATIQAAVTGMAAVVRPWHLFIPTTTRSPRQDPPLTEGETGHAT